MKTCVTCHQQKPVEEFNRRKLSADGYQPRCRDCCKAWYAANRRPHKKAVTIRSTRIRGGLRQRLADYFSEHPCVDCGEADLVVLEFDHRPGEDKVSEVTAMVSAGLEWDRILTEIAKCDVRCVNCHRRVTSQRAGWWREAHVSPAFDPVQRLRALLPA